MKTYLKISTIIMLCINALPFYSQVTDSIDIQLSNDGKIKYIRFGPKYERTETNDTLFLKKTLEADDRISFGLISYYVDDMGFSHKKYQQYYKGLKVEGAEYLLHEKDNNLEAINGNFEKVKIIETFPELKEDQALEMALDYVKASKYKWEDSVSEEFIRKRRNNPTTTYFPKGELVILKDENKDYKLSWKFIISSLIPNNEQIIYIDAILGGVIADVSLILDANVTGNAQTIYSGTKSIVCDSYIDGYRLLESRTTTTGHQANIHTWDALNGSNYGVSVEFSNSNINWTTGSWPDINDDQAALDAHWGAEKVLDYWSSEHSRNSIDNLGLAIIGYVHYNAGPPVWPNNAQWDGTNHVIRYGNGDGTLFTPITALDVVAHEIGHGINQYTAHLGSTYNNQECDALNEGFSDIWGAAIEYDAAPEKQTWLIGEEIFNSTYTCIRNLQNPKSTTTAEGQHPDTYHGDYWSTVGEPHCN